MKRTCIAAAIMALTGVAGAVTTNNWIYPAVITKGLSVTNAASWSDPDNWAEGSVPSSTGDGAYVSNALAVPFYIKVDESISISWLRNHGKAETYTTSSAIANIISDAGVTLNSYSDYNTLKGIRLYADLSLPYSSGASYMSSCILCGDVSLPKTGGFFGINMYTIEHRMDFYANAAGETRSGIEMANFRNSWGALDVYAPHGSATDVSGTWVAVKDSPYIFRKGAEHVISAGTIVECDGILPPGAFVKRVFDNATVELSESAIDSTQDGGAAFTFKAFMPNVTMRVGKFYRNSNGDSLMRLNKHRAEDGLRCTVGDLVDQAFPFRFDTVSGYFPGTFVFTRTEASKCKIDFGNCRLEFEAAADGKKSGFPNCCAKMSNASNTARLTVQSGVTASIFGITNLIGTIVKDGAGTLETALTNAVAKNTGTIVVKEGTLSLCAPADWTEQSYVKTLAISNGATLKLPPNGLKVDTVAFENGAIISGDGALILPAKVDLSGVTFTDGASIRLAGGSGIVMAAPPAAAVVGNPALWMDVSATDTLQLELEDGTNFVTRMDDVRGPEYGFATNVALRPWLEGDKFGHTNLYMKGVSVAGITNAPTLVWDKPIRGIRAVFLVHAPREGGGEILGTTAGLYTANGYSAHFLRAAGVGFDGTIVWSGCNGIVRDGKFYVNGELRDYTKGYPYSGYCWGNNNQHYRPVVVESHPLPPGAAADCFSYDASAKDRNGHQRLCECIVYTNTLTEVERTAVARYLMEKWMNSEVNWTPFVETNSIGNVTLGANTPGFAVAGGETGYAESVSGAGTFRKTGAGTMTVGEFADSNAALHVQGGTLEIASQRLSADTLPEDAYLHVDASALDTLTTNVVDGITRVSTWASVNEGGRRFQPFLHRPTRRCLSLTPATASQQ